MPLRRARHKLPTFPPTVAKTFRSLCEDIEADLVPELLPQLDQGLHDIQLRGRDNPLVDTKLATQIATELRFLLENYSSFDAHGRGLIIGAARYFIHDRDPVSDQAFATGFHDDAKVLNYVLEQLEIEGRFISLAV